MKFLSTLLCSVAVSSVYSLVPREDCATQMGNIQECVSISSLQSDKLDEQCRILTSDKCKNLFNDPFSVLTSCKDDATAKSTFNDNNMAAYRFLSVAGCTTDGNNKYCPVSAIVQGGTNFQTLVNDSCSSKACSNALNHYFEYSAKVAGENEVFKKMKEELNADACVKQNVNDVTNGNGNVSTVTGNVNTNNNSNTNNNNSSNNNNSNNNSSDAKLTAKINGSLLFTMLLAYVFLF